MRLSPPGTHFTAESTEAMRIKSLAQGEKILMLGIEPSTFVSKIDILTTTPIVHQLRACLILYTAQHLCFCILSLHTATLTMCPKKSSSNSTRNGKIKVVRTTKELKKEITVKFEHGVYVPDLATRYNVAQSMISTFPKNKEAIKAAGVAKGVTIVHTKQRPQIMDEVEKLKLIWIKEKELDGNSIREGIICEKALHIGSTYNTIITNNINNI